MSFVPNLSHSFVLFFFPIRLFNNKIWKERCRWHVYFSHSMNTVRYFAFLCKVTWTQLYKMFAHVPSQYCHTSLAPSHSREVFPCSYKLYVPCFAQPLLRTVILHWLACRVVYFPPIPIHYIYPVFSRPLSILSYRIGSLAESCIFSCSSTLYIRYFAPPTVSSVISHLLALRVLYFLLFLYAISLICDKSVTTQNIAFLRYWYRNKRLQVHF